MATKNPLKVGDITYDKYAVTITRPVSADLATVKGTIYTVDAAGNLIAMDTTVANGLYQAATASPANAVAGGNSVQCLAGRSRILMAAPAGLTVGNAVGVSPAGIAITKVAKSAINYIGTVFEIYTRPDTGIKKKVTVATDLVIIDIGGI